MELTKSIVQRVDTESMWELLVNFPNQWDEAVKITEDLNLGIDPGRVKNVCITGMGSSAMGGDLVRAYGFHSCPVPVHVLRCYEIPGWVGEDTLFIASSFSGDTEETLAALESARKKGAQPLAITSGGELMLNATRNDFDYIKIPGGMPPRTALAYNFVSHFRVFQSLGFLEERDESLSETELFLSNQGSILSRLDDNEALTLAEELTSTLPIVYSNSRLLEPVNTRWRNQFEENSKTLAYGNVFPELNHNEIVGWEQVAHLTGRLSVIMLTDQEEDIRIQKRMQITKELIGDQAASVTILRSRGESRLTRMFSLIQLADWTSFYLAIINEVDPTPTAQIDLFKSRLAEEQ